MAAPTGWTAATATIALWGNAGDDILRGGAGADTLHGQDGMDTASYEGSAVGGGGAPLGG